MLAARNTARDTEH